MNYKRTLLLALTIFVSITASGGGWQRQMCKKDSVKAEHVVEAVDETGLAETP